MGFEAIDAPATAPKKAGPITEVMVSVTPTNGTRGGNLTIGLPKSVADAAGWSHGSAVDLQRGTNENLGKIALVSGSGTKLSIAARGDGSRLNCRVKASRVYGQLTEHAETACKHDVKEGALIIALPDEWMRA